MQKSLFIEILGVLRRNNTNCKQKLYKNVLRMVGKMVGKMAGKMVGKMLGKMVGKMVGKIKISN